MWPFVNRLFGAKSIKIRGWLNRVPTAVNSRTVSGSSFEVGDCGGVLRGVAVLAKGRQGRATNYLTWSPATVAGLYRRR